MHLVSIDCNCHNEVLIEDCDDQFDESFHSSQDSPRLEAREYSWVRVQWSLSRLLW